MKRFKNTVKILFEILFEEKAFITPLIAILSGFLIFILVSRNFFNDELITENTYSIKIVLLVITMTISVLPILIRFLYTDRERKSSLDEIMTYSKLREESNKSKIVAEQIKDALLKNPDVLNVEKSIYDKIVNNLEVSLINKLDQRFKKDIEAEFISDAIISELSPLTKNTEKYIDRIQRNSIVNLMIGIIGTIASISILAFSILSDKMYSDLSTFLIHFLPRVTFVVFIQLFAFFFLRLYKNNLEDAKYFQNELTNLSAKSSSLRVAYMTKNESLVSEIIKNLSNTERNFKIQKEETLLNIEKAKIEKDFDLETLAALKDFVTTYKKE